MHNQNSKLYYKRDGAGKILLVAVLIYSVSALAFLLLFFFKGRMDVLICALLFAIPIPLILRSMSYPVLERNKIIIRRVVFASCSKAFEYKDIVSIKVFCGSYRQICISIKTKRMSHRYLMNYFDNGKTDDLIDELKGYGVCVEDAR